MPQDRTREYSALAAMAALQLANIVATSDTRHPNLRFSLRRPEPCCWGCFIRMFLCMDELPREMSNITSSLDSGASGASS